MRRDQRRHASEALKARALPRQFDAEVSMRERVSRVAQVCCFPFA